MTVGKRRTGATPSTPEQKAWYWYDWAIYVLSLIMHGSRRNSSRSSSDGRIGFHPTGAPRGTDFY